MNTRDKNRAKALLEGSGLSWTDAARLTLEILESIEWKGGENREERLKRIRGVLRCGIETEALQRKTKAFSSVVESSLRERAHLRPATVADLRYLSARILRCNPGLGARPLRAIDTAECKKALDKAFRTPSQWRKGRTFLHSIFTHGIREGLCAENPVKRLPAPRVHEQEIRALSLNEVKRLTSNALKAEHLECAAAVGLMLWAGIRPRELERLDWDAIDLQSSSISIRARHSKTGGARIVKIHPVLRRWLRHSPQRGTLLPRNWRRKWNRLRRISGLGARRPDTLRHTFASFHAKQWRDYQSLSLEMGHGDIRLLQTRYVNFRGISPGEERDFWQGAWLTNANQGKPCA